MDSSEEEVVTGLQYLKLQSGGHGRFEVFIQLMNACIHLRRIGTRCLEHHEQRTRLAVYVGGEVIAHRTDLDIRYIAQVQQVTAVTRAQHDVVELLDGLERAFVLHRVLIRILRPLA